MLDEQKFLSTYLPLVMETFLLYTPLFTFANYEPLHNLYRQ